jgi:hypothetical protein
MDPADDLITVATFANTAEAELAKERLELEGVSAFVVGGVTAHVMPFLSHGGAVVLQVATEDLDQAREILGLATP